MLESISRIWKLVTFSELRIMNNRQRKAAKALLKRERISHLDSSAQGQLEILREQISVIQETESKALTYFKIMFAVFTALGAFGSYQLYEMVNSVTDKTTELVNETRQEIRFITSRARPESVSINILESNTNGALPGYISTSETDTGRFKLTILFFTSISVESYPGRFIGWYDTTSGALLDWYTRSNMWAPNSSMENNTRSNQQIEFERDRAIHGSMNYSKINGMVTEVIVTPSAPYTGSFSLSVYYDTCEVGLSALKLIQSTQLENGNFGSIFLTPIFDNYFFEEAKEFVVDVSANDLGNINCDDEPTAELNSEDTTEHKN